MEGREETCRGLVVHEMVWIIECRTLGPTATSKDNVVNAEGRKEIWNEGRAGGKESRKEGGERR